MGVRVWEDGKVVFETDNVVDLMEYMTVNRVTPKEINVFPRNDY